jgi:hypothetical protein
MITNDSDGTNASEPISVSNISHTPSCESGVATCKTSDPGVFQLSTGTGAANSACAGVTFNVRTVNAATGEVQFTPASSWTLGPADNSGGPSTCEIDFAVQVAKAPTQGKSAGKVLRVSGPDSGAGTETSSVAHATFANNGQPPQRGSGIGTSTTIVATTK